MEIALKWLGIIADIASLIGLTITAIVWLQVRSIRKSFTLRARLPEISVALKKISAELLNSLKGTIELSNEIKAVVARLCAVLDSLITKANQPHRESAKRLLIRCGRPRSRISWIHSTIHRPLTKDSAWDVYYDLEGLIESLEQAAEDQKWS